jgi:hypothetical protein
VYDPTDIWKAVHEKLNSGTPYGERTKKSAYDLAWTADQAASIFRKRDLDPRLQFIQMFEMEINEIVSVSEINFLSFKSFELDTYLFRLSSKPMYLLLFIVTSRLYIMPIT